MARFSEDNLATALEIVSRYPVAKSATIPLLHLAQEQDGHVTEDAMQHIAELLEVTSAEVLGVASFYEMFKFEPVGTYLVNIQTLPHMMRGGLIADAVAIISSVDPVLGEVDR